jgi:hypothetical protein
VTGHVYVTRLLTDDAMAAVATLGLPVVVGREEPPTAEELRRDVAGAVAVGYDDVDDPAGRARGVVVGAFSGSSLELFRAQARSFFGLKPTNTPRVPRRGAGRPPAAYARRVRGSFTSG